MSSGVSEQMKAPGNTTKNVEERNIPWSQQVDEASYEILASPVTDENAATYQSSMQFQYPPFNAKENQNLSWNNYKSRKTSNSFESNKKHGKPTFFVNTKRDECPPNAWGVQTTRKHFSDNPGNHNRTNKLEETYASRKMDNRQVINPPTEEKKNNTTAPAVMPKKTTWASIASQPAKLTSRAILPALSHKKKGPGMPPPPMVPGKHDLDVNTWDLPNNNPPPVPSPPPQIEPSYAEANSEFSVGAGYDYELGLRPDKGNKASDSSKEENKQLNYNSNFGRVRNSPNGYSRKNWYTQHPLQQQSGRGGGSINTGLIRRPDENIAGSQTRFGERKNNVCNERSEQESAQFDYRDESKMRSAVEPIPSVDDLTPETSQAVLEELRDKNNYNPYEMNLEKATTARFFVIKSYSEDDIHRSIKYEIWCSTDHGNKRLDDAFKERQKEGGNVLLFFSVNGSGHFCGMAQMMTAVDYNSTSSVWSQDKWKGKFKVRWIYVKDVPNAKLRHIRLENNDNKSVTNSRDTQEVLNSKGIEVLQVLHSYKHSTSIFDDFYHYEKKQEEEVLKKPSVHESMAMSSPISRHYNRQNDDRERDRDNRSIVGSQKYFSGSGGGVINFRDRNNSHRGGYHNNYNDQRRFENHRTGSNSDYHQKDRDDRADLERERDSNEYGNRHGQKFDYNQRSQSKNIREREFSEERKSESRFRNSTKEIQKDNEYPSNVDRIRATDY